MSSGSDRPSSREERLNSAIAAYLADVEAGRAPDRQELLRRHPDLAADLQAFWDDHDRMLRAAAEVRPQPAPGPEGEPPLRPRSFGDYELLEAIGRGGLGVVYKARQRSLNRVVALKLIRAGQLATLAEVQRFRREARAAARLDHPLIVPIYEVGEHEGQQYYAMKLIAGRDLGKLVP